MTPYEKAVYLQHQTGTVEKCNFCEDWLAGLAVLVAIGAIAWAIQLSQGMSVTGISQAVVWGVYIATFFTLAGLAGGLVILAVLADLEVLSGLRSAVRNMLIGALVCFVAAGIMILMDIGKPQRILNMVFSANITSPFVWDFLALAVGVIITLVYLMVAQKSRWLAILTGVVAGLVVIVEGWILSMSAGSPLWQGGMMPAIFLVEGILLASALVLITRPSAPLRRMLLVLLPVLFLLNLFDVAAVLYAGEPDAQAAMRLMLANPLFWANVIFGMIVPFVLFGLVPDNRGAVFIAAALVILGVFTGKLATLVAGQALPFMQAQVIYKPTLVEIGGVIGVLGLAGLLYILGKRFLPKP